ncbi:unnamed protein product, partial [marine sediment metagenome]
FEGSESIAIELKRNVLTNKAIWQLSEYCGATQALGILIGEAVAPSFDMEMAEKQGLSVYTLKDGVLNGVNITNPLCQIDCQSNNDVRREDKGKLSKVEVEGEKNIDDLPPSFFDELRELFPTLDIDLEKEKCKLWWDKSSKKKLKNPRLALLNWMQKAVEIQGPKEIDPRRPPIADRLLEQTRARMSGKDNK